jgi:CBS domain-containing protein
METSDRPKDSPSSIAQFPKVAASDPGVPLDASNQGAGFHGIRFAHTLGIRRGVKMKVKEIMSTQVQRIHKGASIQQAAEQMKTCDVGMVPVYEGDRLVGTLTDRDLAVRAVAEKRDPTSTKIGDVMSPKVTYCFEDQDVVDAGNIMAEHQIRRLVVLNRDKRLVGVVSLGDLATSSGSKQMVAEALENISRQTT